MATMIQVILQQDLKNLGKSGELVRVRPGYARNYLIPRSLATPATIHNVKQLEHEHRLFGSVTTKDIVAALKEKGIEIDRKRIELAAPIRAAGTFDVTVKLLG